MPKRERDNDNGDHGAVQEKRRRGVDPDGELLTTEDTALLAKREDRQQSRLSVTLGANGKAKASIRNNEALSPSTPTLRDEEAVARDMIERLNNEPHGPNTAFAFSIAAGASAKRRLQESMAASATTVSHELQAARSSNAVVRAAAPLPHTLPKPPPAAVPASVPALAAANTAVDSSQFAKALRRLIQTRNRTRMTRKLILPAKTIMTQTSSSSVANTTTTTTAREKTSSVTTPAACSTKPSVDEAKRPLFATETPVAIDATIRPMPAAVELATGTTNRSNAALPKSAPRAIGSSVASSTTADTMDPNQYGSALQRLIETRNRTSLSRALIQKQKPVTSTTATATTTTRTLLTQQQHTNGTAVRTAAAQHVSSTSTTAATAKRSISPTTRLRLQANAVLDRVDAKRRSPNAMDVATARVSKQAPKPVDPVLPTGIPRAALETVVVSAEAIRQRLREAQRRTQLSRNMVNPGNAAAATATATAATSNTVPDLVAEAPSVTAKATTTLPALKATTVSAFPTIAAAASTVPLDQLQYKSHLQRLLDSRRRTELTRAIVQKPCTTTKTATKPNADVWRM